MACSLTLYNPWVITIAIPKAWEEKRKKLVKMPPICTTNSPAMETTYKISMEIVPIILSLNNNRSKTNNTANTIKTSHKCNNNNNLINNICQTLMPHPLLLTDPLTPNSKIMGPPSPPCNNSTNNHTTTICNNIIKTSNNNILPMAWILDTKINKDSLLTLLLRGNTLKIMEWWTLTNSNNFLNSNNNSNKTTKVIISVNTNKIMPNSLQILILTKAKVQILIYLSWMTRDIIPINNNSNKITTLNSNLNNNSKGLKIEHNREIQKITHFCPKTN